MLVSLIHTLYTTGKSNLKITQEWWYHNEFNINEGDTLYLYTTDDNNQNVSTADVATLNI